MAQPPSRPVMARSVTRTIPFVTPQTYYGVVAWDDPKIFEYDTLEGFAEPSLFYNVGLYPPLAGPDAPKLHAVGPWLDAAVYIVTAAPAAGTLLVEYAVDRGCDYRSAVAPAAIAAQTFVNISALRITGRFVRVTFSNTTPAHTALTVEFGTYVRSA